MRGDGAEISRTRLPFRLVNKYGSPGYRSGLQRHHLLPREAYGRRGFAALFAALGNERIGCDDFRRNGMLLPATEFAAEQLGLPLHRGPHRIYTELVLERLGAIERTWSGTRHKSPMIAGSDALLRIGLLQNALRKRLLAERRPLQLNRGGHVQQHDFSVLDSMAAQLWSATAVGRSS